MSAEFVAAACPEDPEESEAASTSRSSFPNTLTIRRAVGPVGGGKVHPYAYLVEVAMSRPLTEKQMRDKINEVRFLVCCYLYCVFYGNEKKSSPNFRILSY
jgi:hypothetical protein